MRVSYNWLKELVDLGGIGPQELAEKMTMAGVAVEHLEELGKDIDNVVIGKIMKIDRHPDADKLVVCQIDVNGPELIQIVTGADNVREGHIIPVAVHGAKLPNGLKIKKSKLRGVESNGMLCSGQELGMDAASLPEDQQHGILILPPDLPLGADAKQVLGLDDVILELELTPNRSDCLSMTGVAWEVAAVLGTQVRLPEIQVTESAESTKDLIKIDIADADLCGRYAARIIRNVKIGPSPVWMQQRLRSCGMRPISNLVDITNYVMLELGQPLHAFDYDTIQGQQITVRRANVGEQLVTLDDVERRLDSEMLVIADAKGPVALAGVMGGLHSEVTAQTTNILLEAASFTGPSIRRTSRRLGLRSEASLRFEKGINPQICEVAADRVAQLIAQLGAGEATAGIVDNYPRPIAEKTVELRVARVNKILGIALTIEEVAAFMKRLGFVFTIDHDTLAVQVPTRRVDITIEEDLIEEVVRLYGYNNIPTTLPEGATAQGGKNYQQKVEDLVRSTMTSSGLMEVITLSFGNQRSFDLLGIPADSPKRQAVVIQNPLSEEQGIMRTTLLPGLLEVAGRNYARRVKDIPIFELGNLFLPRGEKEIPIHQLTLGGIVSGETAGAWNQSVQAMDFYYLKGMVEFLAEQLAVTLTFARATTIPGFHPGRTAAIFLGEQEVGVIGQLHPDAAENFGVPDITCAFEINLAMLIQESTLNKNYTTLPKFPGTERDMALLVSKEVAAGALVKTIVANGGKLLTEVQLFDVYQGQQIQAGFKSMAFRLKYQALDRTLTDDEVNAIQARIGEQLFAQYAAQLR